MLLSLKSYIPAQSAIDLACIRFSPVTNSVFAASGVRVKTTWLLSNPLPVFTDVHEDSMLSMSKTFIDLTSEAFNLLPFITQLAGFSAVNLLTPSEKVIKRLLFGSFIPSLSEAFTALISGFTLSTRINLLKLSFSNVDNFMLSFDPCSTSVVEFET